MLRTDLEVKKRLVSLDILEVSMKNEHITAVEVMDILTKLSIAERVRFPPHFFTITRSLACSEGPRTWCYHAFAKTLGLMHDVRVFSYF